MFLTRLTVRVVRSERAGVGKSLYVKRQDQSLQSKIENKQPLLITERVSITLHEKTIDMQTLCQRLLEHTPNTDTLTARIFHIDISHEVFTIFLNVIIEYHLSWQKRFNSANMP